MASASPEATLQRALAGYPAELIATVLARHAQGLLAPHLAQKYPERHRVQNDRELGRYVQELKARHLKTAPPLQQVAYDAKLDVLQNALGLQRTLRKRQGAKLQTVRHIRIAGVFKELAPEFLRMIVVHELAHLREPEHNKAFYALCCHMEPDYQQLEFDLRLHLALR
jgi:hypothetical protein